MSDSQVTVLLEVINAWQTVDDETIVAVANEKSINQGEEGNNVVAAVYKEDETVVDVEEEGGSAENPIDADSSQAPKRQRTTFDTLVSIFKKPTVVELTEDHNA